MAVISCEGKIFKFPQQNLIQEITNLPQTDGIMFCALGVEEILN